MTEPKVIPGVAQGSDASDDVVDRVQRLILTEVLQIKKLERVGSYLFGLSRHAACKIIDAARSPAPATTGDGEYRWPGDGKTETERLRELDAVIVPVAEAQSPAECKALQVHEETLADFLADNGMLAVGEDDELGMARAILQKFDVRPK